jgi:hypothetical protein
MTAGEAPDAALAHMDRSGRIHETGISDIELGHGRAAPL